jgi:hypothetical protein
LYASGANIEGTIKSSDADITGKIVANSGTIGGCTINNGVLYVNDVNINGMSVSKLAGGTNNSTNTTRFNGPFVAPNATINGRIEAESGKIGAWEITEFGYLKSSSVTLSNGGLIAGGYSGASQCTWLQVVSAANGFSTLVSDISSLYSSVSKLTNRVSALENSL